MAAKKLIRESTESEYVSHALRYEADLLDLIKSRNGLQNAELITQHAFTVLDKCIPELGQFVRVIQLIRDQLYNAVYSEKLTECGGNITRLPYFKIIETTELEAEKRLDLKSKDVDVITKRLFEKQLEYENLESEFSAAGSEIRSLQKLLSAQHDRNNELEDKIKDLEERMAAQEDKSEENIRALRLRIAEMQHDLNEKQELIQDLEKYKKGHQELDRAFFHWPMKILARVKNDETVKPITYGAEKPFRTASEAGRHEAAQSISASLTRQIEELEKQLIDGFETESSSVKQALCSRRLIVDPLDPRIEAEEEEMAYQAKRSVRSEKSFIGFMNIASHELDLLKEHEQNASTLIAARALRKKQESNPIDPDDRTKDVLPSEPVTEASENPFIPNDVVLSKYSIIIQVSQDGLHFYDLPVNEPCGMCGLTAVLVCPHRILSRQITIPLTPNTQYIRIVRPTLRVSNAEVVAPPPTSADAKPQTPILPSEAQAAAIAASEVADNVSATGVQMAFGRPKPRDLESEMSLDRFVKAVNEKVEAKLRESVPRELTQQQLYAFCEEFLSHLFATEYAIPHKPASIFDNFFGHVELAYRSKNAAHLVAGDVIHNLPIAVAQNDRYLQLFSLMLNGIVDSSMLKYACLLAEATLTIDWRHPADYWAFALVAYPHLDDEDADIVQMNFTSFTEGRINLAIVLEYQLFCLLRGTEMRYQNMFEQLHEMASGQPSFTEEEFIRAIRDILPRSAFDFNKTKALFQEAYQTTLFWSQQQTASQPAVVQSSSRGPTSKPTNRANQTTALNHVVYFKDAISTERAAQILCYLDMLAIIATVKDNLWTRVLEMRTASAAAEFEKRLPPPPSETPSKELSAEEAAPKTRLIVRYSDAHKLAIQNSKFKRFRMRENLDYEDEQLGRKQKKHPEKK